MPSEMPTPRFFSGVESSAQRFLASWYFGRIMSNSLLEQQTSGFCPVGVVAGLVVEVLVAELERVLAHLLRQHVHGDLGGQERLRRAVGAERRSPGVVGGDRAAVAADVREMVAGARELSLPHGQQIAELGIRAVVDPPVGLHGDQLAFRVAGQLGC